MELTGSRTSGDHQPSPVSVIDVRSPAAEANNVDVQWSREVMVVERDPNVNYANARDPEPVESVWTRIIRAFPFFIVAISLIQILTHYLGGPELRLYLGYDPYRRHEVWRFLTIMLVHSFSSAWHLWNNIIFQLIVGILLEMKHHWKRVGLIYLGGVLGGSLFLTVFRPKIYAVGASAAGIALLFAEVADLILNWKGMNNKFCRVFWLVAYIAVVIVAVPIYNGLILKEDTTTSHAGHAGGMVAGFLISIIVLKTFVNEPWPWEKTARKISGVILITLTLVIVIINIGFPSLYFKSEFNTNYKESIVLWFFQTIDGIPSPVQSKYLKDCLKNEECANAWAAYKNGSRSFKNASFII